MKVRLRLFASFREAVGQDRMEIQVPEGSTMAQIMEVLAAKYPKIAGLAASTVFAVDEEYVSPDRIAQEGDEIVFIPPVSGGTNV